MIVVTHLIGAVSPTNMGFNEFYLKRIGDSRYVELNPKRLLWSFFSGVAKTLYYSFKSDVMHIHSHQAGVFLLCTWALKRFLKYKVVYTVHTSYSNLSKRNRWLFKLNFVLSDRVVFCSESSRSSFPQRFKRSPKSSVINNGVEFDSASSVSIESKQNRIVVLGRLIKIKRPVEILRALSKLKALSEWTLVFIGAGPLADKLEAMSKSCLINVELTGMLSRDEVLAELGRSKVILSFSEVEGLPVSILEGIERYNYPIVSKIPPHEEIMKSGIKGILFSSETELTSSIYRYLSDLRVTTEVLTRNRLLLESNFSLKNMLHEYESLYEDTTQDS